MTSNHNLHTILGELNLAVDEITEEHLEQLTAALSHSGRVFVAGAGRSGLMMKAFAMRLMHLGLDVYVVGETVTRSISEGDLLLIGTGSGETKSLLPMAEKARSLKAKVGTLTLSPESSIGKLSDIIVKIPGAPKDQTGNEALTVQPMGTLFEQMLLIVCDAVILRLMNNQALTGQAMYGNHANLE